MAELERLARKPPTGGTTRRARARSRELRAQLVHWLFEWFDWSAKADSVTAQVWRDRRPFILYLRNFALDGFFEQHFEAAIQKVAADTPIISLAGIGLQEYDVAPKLGVADDAWTGVLARLVRAAHAIIVHSAEASDGLVTELRLIRAAGRQAATLVVPGVSWEAVLRREGNEFEPILDTGFAAPDLWSRAIATYTTVVGAGELSLDPRLILELGDYPHVVHRAGWAEIQQAIARFVEARAGALDGGEFSGDPPETTPREDDAVRRLAGELASADMDRAMRTHYAEADLDEAEHLFHRGLMSAWAGRHEDLQLSALLYLGLLQLDRRDYRVARGTLELALRLAARLHRPVQITLGTGAAVRALLADGWTRSTEAARTLLVSAWSYAAVRDVPWRRAMLRHAESLVLRAEGERDAAAAMLEAAIADYRRHRDTGGRPVGNRAAQVARVSELVLASGVDPVIGGVEHTPMPRDLRRSLLNALRCRATRGLETSVRIDIAELGELRLLTETLAAR